MFQKVERRVRAVDRAFACPAVHLLQYYDFIRRHTREIAPFVRFAVNWGGNQAVVVPARIVVIDDVVERQALPIDKGKRVVFRMVEAAVCTKRKSSFSAALPHESRGLSRHFLQALHVVIAMHEAGVTGRLKSIGFRRIR